MKRIYLVRHSKAGQTNKHMLNDHERTLTKKGEEQAPKIAYYFLKNYKDNFPEIILSSTAIRAKQTSALFRKHFTQNTNIEIKNIQELYITSKEQILSVINSIENKFNSTLIVSHCPGLQDFCIDFAHSGDKVKFRDMRANFPPGSFAVFDIDVKNWKDVKPNSGVLLDFINGKKLGLPLKS